MKSDQANRSSSLRREEIRNSKELKQSSPRKSQIANQPSQAKFVILGVCAMKKKVESKPMRQILKRIACPEIKIVEMWECLDKSYKEWPVINAMICFYSEGFPYLKAWKYVKKHKPFLINNLQKQEYLWDRTAVYDILKRARIPVAKHYMLFQDMNYIDEIERKSFYTESQLNDIPPQTPKFYDNESTYQLKMLKTESVDSSSLFGSMQSYSQKDFLGDKDKQKDRKGGRKQTFDMSFSQKFDNNQKAEEIREVLSAKRPNMREIGSETRPNTLRKFHQERLCKIEALEIQEGDDELLIKGKQTVYKLKKPFVQKPFDAQNHQICIYYPESMGGGRKMLFRKVKNSSSTYEQNQNRIRRDGNYIYEQYLPNNAFDIKVYTIGQFYMYAEARKSPTLDGVVERDEMGKEKRFPIILTPEEKFIAKKIVQEFGQEVCGFDLLRANGKSYVCDVNGWSFVKSNQKYWIDCAIILQKKILHYFFPHLTKEQTKHFERFNMPSQNSYLPEPSSLIQDKRQELRSIVSIFRHGDRSPKLKLKFKTSEPKFMQFFSSQKENQIKIKDANSLIKLLQITLEVIGDNPNMKASDLAKLGQMKTVLESGGHFQGLNRKCQMKVINRDEDGKIEKVLIVFKWGGELSAKGSNDAVELGKRMRMEKYNDDQDFLSLHSSYRHDLKTYSSDEGRCIKTAASFLKGFLNIEGGLAPIITSMVMTNKKAQNLLDCTSEQNHSILSEKIVKKLSDMLNSSQNLAEVYQKEVNGEEISPIIINIMKQIGSPREKLKQMHKGILELTLLLQNEKLAEYYNESEPGARLSNNSTEEEQKQDIVLIYQRWSKLQKDFYIEDQMRFNISKIPEIYDTIRHDLSKNSKIFSHLEFDSVAFMSLAKLFAYFVVSNEYGITNEYKICTAQQIASPLLDKILADLMFWKVKEYEDQYWKYQNQNGHGEDWKHIRTRLYFTSASHIYSVLHLLTLGNNGELINATPALQADKIKKFVYMSYLSHIEFRLYQNLQTKNDDPNRFRVELSIYPDFSKGSPIEEGVLGTNGFTIDQIQKFITSVTKMKKQDEIDFIQRVASKTNDIEQIQKKLNTQATLIVNHREKSKIKKQDGEGSKQKKKKDKKDKKKNKKKKGSSTEKD